MSINASDSFPWSPDGAKLAAAHGIGDATSGEKLLAVEGLASNVMPRGVSWSSDGTYLASMWTPVRIWNAKGVTQHTFRLHPKVRSMAWSPKGDSLAMTMNDGTVRIWELSMSHGVHTLGEYGTNRLTWVDDRTLALEDATRIHVIEKCSGRVSHTLIHPTAVTHLVSSTIESTLATAGDDGVIRLWNCGTGSQLQTLPRQEQSVLTMAFSPDGTILTSASASRAYVWDVEKGRLIRSLDSLGMPITVLQNETFSP